MMPSYISFFAFAVFDQVLLQLIKYLLQVGVVLTNHP